ncbi:probable pectinesterase 29 [Magnolia sinica]|uniref:probable pectinesterase 29 n=1 Tax=Magnolia sinica TaxID=86752 RepID=UPI00265A7FF5|nr:probable pectinesterase 29 [Magnolia sinica]
MRFFLVFFVFISVYVVFCFGLRIGRDVEIVGAPESTIVRKTITVDKSGHGDFTRIQSAIDSVPSFNSHWIRIRIRSGIYKEQVIVPIEKPFIMLEGDGPRSTIISWGDAEDLIASATFSVWAGNFVARRITFENTYNRVVRQPKQAVAAMVYGDKCSFYECGFISLQDTLFDCMGRHYFYGCYIEGAIDFIFGTGQSIYEKCMIYVKTDPAMVPIGVVTAQGRDDPSDTSGFVFKYCEVHGTGMTYLGRAWRAYSRVLFFRSKLTGIVIPEGWDAWNFKDHEYDLSLSPEYFFFFFFLSSSSESTTCVSQNGVGPTMFIVHHRHHRAFNQHRLVWDKITYAEYGCNGAGSNTAHRVRWVKKLSESEVTQLSSLSFIDSEGWIKQQP